MIARLPNLLVGLVVAVGAASGLWIASASSEKSSVAIAVFGLTTGVVGLLLMQPRQLSSRFAARSRQDESFEIFIGALAKVEVVKNEAAEAGRSELVDDELLEILRDVHEATISLAVRGETSLAQIINDRLRRALDGTSQKSRSTSAYDVHE